MKRALIILMVIAFAGTAPLIVKLRSLHARRASVGQSMCIRGQTAPNFALQSLDGKTVHLSDFHGRAVLLHFWSTSWLPCGVEMQCTAQMQRHNGPQGLQAIGIAMNKTDKKAIAEYASNLGL